MKEVILLTKVLLKSALNKTNNKKNNKIGMTILYIIAFGYLAGISTYISYECILSLSQIHQEILFLQLAFSGIIVFAVIQTLFTSLNLLFFSKDIENLLPLPISPLKIIMAKFNCLIISQYCTAGIILLPLLAVYGILLNCSLSFYLISILVVLLIPIVPVVLSALLVVIVMKFTKIIKNKEAIQYISVFLIMLFVIAIQFFAGNAEQNQVTNQELANEFVANGELINTSSNTFVTTMPAINAIQNYNNFEGIKNLIILILETVIVYFGVCKLLAKTYIKTAIKFVSMGSKKGKKINLSKDFSSGKIWETYVKKEFKILVRNPIFFMQCILPSILFPVVFSIPIFAEYNTAEFKIAMESFGDVNSKIGFGVSLVLIILLYTFNFIALTAISRDGTDSVFMKQIPISLDKQIFYKILPGIILNIIPTVYVLVIEKILFANVEIQMLVVLFITAFIINVLNNYLMILIDLKNPKLNWTTEYAVVKQNFNMFFQFVVYLLETAIIIGISSILELQELQVVIFAISVLGTILVRKYIKQNQIKIFRKIN